MRSSVVAASISLLVAACGRLGFDPRAESRDGSVVADGTAPDAISPLAPFDTATRVDELFNPNDFRDHPSLTADQRTMFLNIQTSTDSTLWQTQRASTSDPWGPLVPISELLSSGRDSAPEISADGLDLHFTSDRGQTSEDIWVATRARVGDPWTNIEPVAELNSADAEHSPALTPDRLRIVFDRNGQLFEASRPSPTVPWDSPLPLTQLNQAGSYVGDGFWADDGLTLYFDSNVGSSDANLYVATRTSVDASFEEPVAIDLLNTADSDAAPWLSPDGRTIVFSRATTETQAAIFMATR